jgi:hypothetical protein
MVAPERLRGKLKLYRAAVLKAAVEGALTAEWRKQHPQTEPASELLERILAERRRHWEEEQLCNFAEKGREPPRARPCPLRLPRPACRSELKPRPLPLPATPKAETPPAYRYAPQRSIEISVSMSFIRESVFGFWALCRMRTLSPSAWPPASPKVPEPSVNRGQVCAVTAVSRLKLLIGLASLP